LAATVPGLGHESNAASPVMSWPTTSVWISWVPS
jgi:hypothetical protein